MEKERYIYTKIDGYHWIKDTETNENYCANKTIVKLLNQQDARIKELEEQIEKERTLTKDLYLKALYQIDDLREENQQLKEKYVNLYKCYQKTSQEDLKYKYDLAEKNEKLKQSQKQLAIENCVLKREKLYFDLLFTRLQYIHKQANECREERERFGGIKNMALDSIWRVFDLQKHECCEYEEMAELEIGIESIANDMLLRNIEHDLQFKPTRTIDEIFKEIQKIDKQIKELRGENEVNKKAN